MICDYFRNCTRPPPISLTKSILFSTHLSLPPSSLSPLSAVRQLAGLLPVKLHERTGGSTFLLNIALHSGDSLPSFPLLPSLCLCPLLYRNIQLDLQATLPSKTLFTLLLFFVGNCGKNMLFCVCVCAAGLALHSWRKLSFHMPFSYGRTATLTQFDNFFCEDHLACRAELA